MSKENTFILDGNILLKSRIIGFKRSHSSHNYFERTYTIDLITDMGGIIKCFVANFDYNNQAESDELAQANYKQIEDHIKKELDMWDKPIGIETNLKRPLSFALCSNNGSRVVRFHDGELTENESGKPNYIVIEIINNHTEGIDPPFLADLFNQLSNLVFNY
jgi:hypothetical protein